jgi:hypothetical protein
MSDFSIEAEKFIGSLVDRTFCTSSAVGCKIVFVPAKNLCFHLLELRKADGLQSQDLLDIAGEYACRDIQMIQLWEDLWFARHEQITSRIKALCGSFNRLHARETSVITLNRTQFDVFINANHLQGAAGARFKYGLVYRDILVAAAAFASFRNYRRDGKISRSTELVRFANLNGYIVAGGLGKLLAHFERKRKPDDIMTYADRDWATGKSYRKLGFMETGTVEPQAFCVNTDDYTRRYFDGQNLRKNEIIVYNTGNIKFLKVLNDSRQSLDNNQ